MEVLIYVEDEKLVFASEFGHEVCMSLGLVKIKAIVCITTEVQVWRDRVDSAHPVGFLYLVYQVTRGMFGANRKKFMEGVIESDYADDASLYYSQQSMFPPHRADKEVSCRCIMWTEVLGPVYSNKLLL